LNTRFIDRHAADETLFKICRRNKLSAIIWRARPLVKLTTGIGVNTQRLNFIGQQVAARSGLVRFAGLVLCVLVLSACSSDSGQGNGENAMTDGIALDAGATDNIDTGNPDTVNPDNGTTDPDTGNNTNNTNTGSSDTGTTDNGSDTSTNLPAITVPDVLPPLPSPPLTPAPNTSNEPVPVTGPVSTVSEFFLVRDPYGKLPDDTSADLTLEDFNLGPLPAVVTTPSDVNPTINTPPYFINLENPTVFAGDVLEVLFDPEDDNGTRPGMFPNYLRDGWSLVDNLNNTRTFRWQPLQPDVGIHEFKITAVDEAAPLYRTEQTIRIQVLLPADESAIPNLPPVVDEIRPHTTKFNDPVVMTILVNDPNGTVPTLEIVNPPPGATITPHHAEPNVSILRFVPQTTGVLTIDAIARDSVDTTLTGTQTFTIDVRDASFFQREGTALRDIATARNFRLGYASLLDFYYRPDGAIYAQTAAREFNFVTTENSLKWSYINPLPGIYRFAAADNLVSFARLKGMEIHGHTLVWHVQLPDWLKTSAPETREGHMREFIDRIMTRYADDIPIWDVVNEVFENDGTYRESLWFEAMGLNYIDIAFKQARLSAPNARLIYNDNDVSWAGPKANAMFDMLQGMQDRNTPIDGVGFQMHIFTDFDKFDEVEANFQRAADLDLDVYITELDVSKISGGTDEQQAVVYERVLDICLKQPRCKGLQTWGFTDMYSWRSEFEPLLLDEKYQVKPAYTAFQRRLLEN